MRADRGTPERGVLTQGDPFIADARAALATLVGAGAISAGPDTLASLHALARRARGLGVADLGARLDGIAALLEHRGASAFEASVPIAYEICAVHDRIVALATTLALWGLEQAFFERMHPHVEPE